MSAADELTRLLGIMETLRDPATGCPWDQIQDFDSIAPYTIEEAYEVADAIARRDWTALPDELGDLLLQIVFYASMAGTEGRFDFATVARSIADKMVRRHPLIFPDPGPSPGHATRESSWEEIKKAERHARDERGTLAGIAVNLPALQRADKLCARAARVGFDWPEPSQVMNKLDEELAELRAELAGADPARLQDEVGDVLFTAANLARKLGLDPESCLRHANNKFQRRFVAMEQVVETAGRSLADASLSEMEAGWEVVKQAERAAGSAPYADSSVS